MTSDSISSAWPGFSHYQTALGEKRVYCFPPQGANRHQVVIIGGGLAGLSTAWSLLERGAEDIAICEAGQPGDGASGRNGGFVFAGYSLPNQKLFEQAGPEAARELHRWTREAVSLVRHRIDHLAIDCQPNDAGVLLADWFHDDASLKTFADNMSDQLGFTLDWVGAEKCAQYIQSDRYGSALHEPGSFHFNPLQYVNGLVKALQGHGVTIYGNCPVTKLETHPKSQGGSWSLDTGDAKIVADQVILTTGGYDTRLWPKLGRSIQPIATYVATTPPLGEKLGHLIPRGHAIYDTRFAFDYYRPLPDTRLLWGGRISIKARSPEAIRAVLKKDLIKVFPDLADVEFDHAWGGWMGYTRHQMPLIGQDSSGLWHATGFGGHGMAPTTMAGEVIAEAFTGTPERLALFKQWQPVWAGGPIGRAWAQGTYWALNMKDCLRDRSALSRASRA